MGLEILCTENSSQTYSSDLPNNVDGYKNRILDSVLAAGGCTLTTAEPPRLQSAVVINISINKIAAAAGHYITLRYSSQIPSYNIDLNDERATVRWV